MLACIFYADGMMMYDRSMCILTGLSTVTSTRHHTKLTRTLIHSIHFILLWMVGTWDESNVQVFETLFVYVPNSTVCRHLYDIFAVYESHMVPEEYQSMSVTSQWSYVDNYMTWFYGVSHPVMTPETPRHSPRPAHEEILENE